MNIKYYWIVGFLMGWRKMVFMVLGWLLNYTWILFTGYGWWLEKELILKVNYQHVGVYYGSPKRRTFYFFQWWGTRKSLWIGPTMFINYILWSCLTGWGGLRILLDTSNIFPFVISTGNSTRLLIDFSNRRLEVWEGKFCGSNIVGVLWLTMVLWVLFRLFLLDLVLSILDEVSCCLWHMSLITSKYIGHSMDLCWLRRLLSFSTVKRGYDVFCGASYVMYLWHNLLLI